MLNGFRRGLEQMADFLNWVYYAIAQQDDDLLLALMNVARVWFKELTGAQIEARSYSLQSIIIAIALGRDVFAGSRALFREVKEQHPRG